MWLTIWVAVAHAAVPVADPPIPLPEPAISLAIGPLDGGVVVAGGAASLRAYATDGALLADVPGVEAEGLALVDRDGDGRTDVVTCGPDGLQWLPWPIGGLDAPILLDAEPCSSVVAVPGGLAVGGSDVRVYADDGAGGVAPAPARYVGDGAILAARGADVAWLAPGATTFAELGALGVAVLPVGGQATGIAASDAGWMLAWDAMLRDTAGVAIALADPPGRIATAHLDTDGVLDTVVAYPAAGEIGVRTASGETRVAVGPVNVLATGDVDADGCADVVVDDPAGLVLVRMAFCVALVDADGDGAFTPDDCDDSSAAVFPGAPDACNGVDDDCDGAVDEPGDLTLTGPSTERFEGDEALVYAALTGCRPNDAVATWTIEGDAACEIVGFDVICLAADQGTSHLAVEVVAGETPLGAAELDIVWSNVAPVLKGRHIFRVGIGEAVVETLVAEDVPADFVTFTSAGLLDWIQLSPSGSLSIDAPYTVTVDFTVFALDEDGGETSREYTIIADDPDTGEDSGVGSSGCEDESPGCEVNCCGGCCGSSGGASFVWIAGLAALIRARRRAREVDAG